MAIKYDCTKIFDYRHEVQRFCEAHKNQGCDNCLLMKDAGYCSASIFNITQERIDFIQKWSDENCEVTRKEAFLKHFPKTNDVTEICFNNLLGIDECNDGYYGNLHCEGERCYNCWQKPYKGEYEND